MDETTHQLSFRHRSEAKALKDALEKERRDLLRGVKGKKERKRVVSEHKRTVRAREKEMTERHKREAAELCARARANSASDTANTDTVPESKPQGAALVRGQLNTAAPDAPSLASIAAPIQPSADAQLSDDDWATVSSRRKKSKAHAKSKGRSNATKATTSSVSLASSSINLRALGALCADAVCTELRRAKARRVLSLGCRTEAQLISRVRDGTPLVEEICCVDENSRCIEAVREEVSGAKAAGKSRPRNKVLQVHLAAGSPWHWSSVLECEDESGTAAGSGTANAADTDMATESDSGTTASATPASPTGAANLASQRQQQTGQLLVAALQCASDTVVLANVLETMPSASCLLALQHMVFNILNPRRVIVVSPNREFNPVYNMHGLRSPDHRFEWNRVEFQTWCGEVCSRFENKYTVSHSTMGSPPEGHLHGDIGDAYQIAVFSLGGDKSDIGGGSSSEKEVNKSMAVASISSATSNDASAKAVAAPPTEEQGYELFARAVRGLLLAWPLLVFSRTHGTGGKDTSEKIDDIVEDVLHNFKERWERADVDIRAKNARVYVEEVAPFLYEVMEKDLNLEIEDSSPEMYAGHIIRMFEACRFKSNFDECHKALAFVNQQKGSEASLAAAEAAAATEAFHAEVELSAAEDSGGNAAVNPAAQKAAHLDPMEWCLVAHMRCHDMYMHNDGARHHGNASAQSNAKHRKQMKLAAKNAGKKTRAKSSWTRAAAGF